MYLSSVYLPVTINSHGGIPVLIEIQSGTMAEGCVLPYFQTTYCPLLYFPMLGEVPFTRWGWLRTMEQIP